MTYLRSYRAVSGLHIPLAFRGQYRKESQATAEKHKDSTYIIILGETKELFDLGRPLGAEALGVGDVGQTSNLSLTLLDDNQSQNGQVHSDDATPDGLPLPLTGPPGAVAGVASGQEKTDTGWVHDTLLHGETLLVVATGDPKDVAGELGADAITRDFLAHALIHEGAEAALIFDLNQLLGAVGRVAVGCGNVELVLDVLLLPRNLHRPPDPFPIVSPLRHAISIPRNCVLKLKIFGKNLRL